MPTATHTTIPKSTVQKYLKADIFKEIGLERVTPEERMHFLESFGNVLQKRMTFRIMQELPPRAQEELDALAEKNPNDDMAIAKFLSAALPNFQQIMEEEVAHYKKELIQRMNAK